METLQSDQSQGQQAKRACLSCQRRRRWVSLNPMSKNRSESQRTNLIKLYSVIKLSQGAIAVLEHSVNAKATLQMSSERLSI